MARNTSKAKRPVVKPTQRRSLSQRALKAALARFTRRVTDLVLAYAAAGRLTRKLGRATLQLKDDIDSWRARTGRNDIRATHSTLTSPENGTWTCDNCALIIVSLRRLCFLVGCDEKDHNCSYACIELPRNHNLRR
jgi:uncharacterized protein YhdP